MPKTIDSPTLLSTIMSTGAYKESQGRIVRQVTLATFLAAAFVGAYQLHTTFLGDFTNQWVSLGVPALVFAIGAWCVYRLVQWPRFADFLVSVQGELDKVNWATGEYLIRATGVVMVTMVICTVFLWVCNFVWINVFEFVGFLRATN